MPRGTVVAFKKNDKTQWRLAANDYITCRVNAMKLRNRVCDIESDRRDCIGFPNRVLASCEQLDRFL